MDALTAMKQALEAMERYKIKRQDFDRFAEEIVNLRNAIEKMGKSEPVAWVTGGDCYADGHIDCYAWVTGEFTTPLYATHQLPLQADSKDIKIADLKAEVMTLRAQIQEVIDPRWILHIRDGGIVASSIKDPLENGDYYIIKKGLSD